MTDFLGPLEGSRSPGESSPLSEVSPTFARAVEDAAQHVGVAQNFSEAAPSDGSPVALATRRLRYLSQIGLALSAERDIRRLLAMILTASRELTSADGGTLYIIETDANGQRKLVFRAAQNDSIIVDTNMSFAVAATSLAGYTALSGEILRIDDVYHLPADVPYEFSSRFDEEHGYRTKSVLVVPLRDHKDETIGVLQLINRKRQREIILRDAATVEREVIGFDAEGVELARTLASQAAVALNNNLLLQEIEALFEAFVVASSTAIEDRDPTTSGHSRRVTELTLSLAGALNSCANGPYARVRFTPAQLRELRYAALLHDFGKIGVREAILTKSHKIESARFEAIQSRIAIFQAQRQTRLALAKTEIALSNETLEQKQARMAELDCADTEECTQLKGDALWLARLNEPPVDPLSQDEWNTALAALERLRTMFFRDLAGAMRPLLEEDEVQALCIRRGTLTPGEFRQIQDHAQMSWEFLSQIPWTRGLEQVPSIAQAHHERLDGSGYPLGLTSDAIPLGAKMMAIADVYDALTASDRPYKRAMTPQKAIEILEDEARRGKLDGELLSIFVDCGVWQD